MEGVFRSALLLLCSLLLFPAISSANDLTVGDLTLVSSQRAGRTAFDYTYKVDLTSAGGAYENVTATITSSSPYTTITEGDLSFPDAASGATVTSTDTFTLRQDRRVAFDPGALSFNISATSAESTPLGVRITSPVTLLTVGSTPLPVNGTITDPNSTLTLNGAPIQHSGGTFSASVSLEEGSNTIVARAVDAQGNEVTDSIVTSMDLTPPYVTVESPEAGQTVSTATIAVSGLVNDIVRGTIAEDQANVLVNGVQATVANRSYLAENIPLQVGENQITVSASDQVGNTASTSISVRYELPASKHIQLVSGQNQRAQIRSALSNPLAVKLIGSDGQPVPNNNVVFRVTQGDGVLTVGTDAPARGALAVTDGNGVAQADFQLGSRSGNGNHRVRATAVGFDAEVVFYASADTNPGDKVSVNSGNNQRGAVNQPLPQPFVVAVTDEGANVVEGASVEFTVTRGGGKFQNDATSYTTRTDSDGRATAHLTLGLEAGLDVHRVSATLVGTSLNAGFTASALQPGNAGNTRISGVVFDNQDTPLPGVTIRVDGTNRQAVTDEQGQFLITEVPVGPVHLLADGSTATVPGEWPTLSYNLVTIAGAENPLPAPIYLVKLDTDNAVRVGAQDAVITVPGVPGFKLEVKAGSVTFPDGSREGLMSVTPVNASKVPMAPPNGMQPQFIVTIQPVGTRFDPPAPLTLPNVDGHLPGAQVEMYSYDHDLEEFVSIGVGTVSADGSLIRSNNGIGVIKAGWHCGSQPSGSGCTHNCPECADCNAACNCFWDDSLTPTSLTDTPGDCKKPGCQNGPKQVDDDTDELVGEICKECKNGALQNKVDGLSGESCKLCKNGTVEDLTAFTAPTAASALNYLPVGSATPTGWGVTVFEDPVINTGAYCAGTTWKLKVTKADSQINQGSRLLPGVVEVTNALVAAATNCATLSTMKTSLDNVANQRPDSGYYKLSAVEAHEDVHVTEYQADMVGVFTTFKSAVEGLSIPLEDALTAVDANIFLTALTGYIVERNKFDTAEIKANNDTAAHNPITPFVTAEHGAVDSMIVAIDARRTALSCPR